jgi:hypothetical protein
MSYEKFRCASRLSLPKVAQVSVGGGLNATARDHPLGGLAGYRRNLVEIRVVVEHGEPRGLGGGSDEQVGDQQPKIFVAPVAVRYPCSVSSCYGRTVNRR